jgi:DNA invertase Pin-like site-specific DNA recombinase
MKLGYARVSTEDQRLTLQLDALKKAGCKRIYREKVTGAYRDRPELNRMLENKLCLLRPAAKRSGPSPDGPKNFS